VIIGVCADKGTPGVTTLATVLGLVWPGEPIVMEADPAGGDLTLRLRNHRTPTTEFLPADPGLFQLAADARTGLMGDGRVARYAQQTTLGVRVIPAPMLAEQFTVVRPFWPLVAQQVAASRQVVLADLGRLQPGHAAWPIAQAATAVLVLVRPDPEGLHRVRVRVAQLAADLGEGKVRNPVAVVLRTTARQARRNLEDVTVLLQAAGSPIPVAGWMADDPPAIAALRGPEMTRALRSSDLLGSVRDLAEVLIRRWPVLGPDIAAAPRPSSGTAPGPAAEPATGPDAGSGGTDRRVAGSATGSGGTGRRTAGPADARASRGRAPTPHAGFAGFGHPSGGNGNPGSSEKPDGSGTSGGSRKGAHR